MQIFLQIFLRYLCSHSLTSTACCWQPVVRLAIGVLVDSLWEFSSTPALSSACLHRDTLLRWKSWAFLAWQMLKYYSNGAQGCGSQSSINWESLAKSPFVTANSKSYQGTSLRGCVLKSLAGSHFERFLRPVCYINPELKKNPHIHSLKTILWATFPCNIYFVVWV